MITLDGFSLYGYAKQRFALVIQRCLRAYGVRASHGGGVFTFTSYRDPNTTETIDKFDKSIQWLVNGKFTEEDINEAKLAVFQALDLPVTPESKGNFMFIHRLTPEQRNQVRHRLLDVTKDQLIEVVKRRLLGQKSGVGYAILGPKTENVPHDWKVVEH